MPDANDSADTITGKTRKREENATTELSIFLSKFNFSTENNLEEMLPVEYKNQKKK